MNDMNSKPFSRRFRVIWLLKDDMVKSWVLPVTLFLCLTQWITIGMAQSSTGPSNVPGSISPPHSTGSIAQTPSTRVTITNSDTASMDILNSQSTETFEGRTTFSSRSTSDISAMSSILYKSNDTFFSVSTFSSQTVARSDSIFTSSSEAFPSYNANTLSIAKSSTLHESTISDSKVFQTSSTYGIRARSSSDLHSTSSLVPPMNSISASQPSGSDSRSSNEGTLNAATFSTSQLRTASSENATTQPERTSYVGRLTASSTIIRSSRFESSSAKMTVLASGISLAASSNTSAVHSSQFSSNTTAVKGQDSSLPIQSSVSTSPLPSIATLSTSQLLQPSGLISLHQPTVNASSQPLQPSEASFVLPSVATMATSQLLQQSSVGSGLSQLLEPSVSSIALPLLTTMITPQSLQPPSLASSLPSGANLSSQSFKSSVPASLLPQSQQPLASASSVPSVDNVSSQPFQSSVSTSLLPSIATVTMSQSLELPSLASSLPSASIVSTQPFQSSLPTSLSPSIATMTTSQLLQPPTLASSLHSVANVSSQPFQSSVSTSLLPSIATITMSQSLELPSLASSLPSASIVSTQPFQSSLPTSLSPSIATMTTSQLLQPPTLASSLHSVANVSSQPFQSSVSTSLLPSIATVTMSQSLELPSLASSLPSASIVSTQPFQSSLPTSLSPSIATMTTSQLLQPPTLASSLHSVANVSSQPFQSSVSTSLLPSVVTMTTSQSLKLPALASSLSLAANVSSQPFQSSIPTSLLPSVVTMTTSQLLQPPTLASSLHSVANVSSQPFQSSVPTSLLPSVVTMTTSQSLKPPALASSFSSTANVSYQPYQSSVLTSLVSSIATLMSSHLLQSPTASLSSVATESFQSTSILLKPSTTLRRALTEVVHSSLEATVPTASVHLSGSVTNRLFVGTTYGEVSLSTLAATSKSADALSSVTSLLAPQENIVYSSIYPCWISYFIERSVDVSALYPNQTLPLSDLFKSTSLYSNAAAFYTPVVSEMRGSASEKSSNQLLSASSMALGLSVYALSDFGASLETPALTTSVLTAGTIYSTARVVNTVPSSLHSNTPVNNVSVSYRPLSMDNIQSTSIIASSRLAADSTYATSLSASQSNLFLSSVTQTIPLSTMTLSALPSLGNSSPSTAVANLIAKKRRRRAVVIDSNGVTITVPDQSLSLSTAVLTTQLETTVKTPGTEIPSSVSPSINQLPTVSSSVEISTTIVTTPSESPLEKSNTASLDLQVTSSTELQASPSIQSPSSAAPTKSSSLPESQTISPTEVVSVSPDVQTLSSPISSQSSSPLELTTTALDSQTILQTESASASSSVESPSSTMLTQSSSLLESTTASSDSQSISPTESVSASSSIENPSSTMLTQSSSLLESTTASSDSQSISPTHSVSASSSIENPSSTMLTQSSSLLESTTTSSDSQSISPTQSISASSSIENLSSTVLTQSSSLLESTTPSSDSQSISPTQSVSASSSIENPSSTMLTQSSSLLESTTTSSDSQSISPTQSVSASSSIENPSSTMLTQSSSLLESTTASSDSQSISPTQSVSASSSIENPSSTMLTQSSSLLEPQTISPTQAVSIRSSVASMSSAMPTKSSILLESQTPSVAQSVPNSLNVPSPSSTVPIQSSSLIESTAVLPNSQTILSAKSVQASSDLQVSFSTVFAQPSSLLQPTSLSLDFQTNIPTKVVPASSNTQIASSAVYNKTISMFQPPTSLLDSQRIPGSTVDQLSSLFVVPSSLLSLSVNSLLSTTGILDTSTQTPLIQTSIPFEAPPSHTSNAVLPGSLATAPTSSYPIQETPVMTLQTLSPSTPGGTLQLTPSASSTGGIVRLLTSSLGQCIAYFTSKVEPQIITQSVGSSFSISSIGYASDLAASMSSSFPLLQSSEHSARLPTPSTAESLNRSSLFLTASSSKLATSVPITEMSLLFSNTISFENASMATSSIFPSNSILEASVSSILPSSMLNETAITLSMIDSSLLAVSSPSSSEAVRSVIISTEASFHSLYMQPSSSFQQAASSSATEGAQYPSTVYGSSSVTQMITLASSLSGEASRPVDASSVASVRASTQPTGQTVGPSTSGLPSASSALDSAISISTFFAAVADSSFVSTQNIRLSTPLPVSNVAASVYSVGQYIPTSGYPSSASLSTSQLKLLTTAASTAAASSSQSSVAPIPSATTLVQVHSVIVVTQPTQPPQAISVGLCSLLLSVSQSVDISTFVFKENIERNLLNTYLKLKLKRKRRAVTQGTTTLNVTSITRQGSTQNVETQFYVTENDVVVEAQKTSSTFNRLKTTALSAFLNQTVASPVNVVSAITQAPTIIAPTQNQLLGMVLADSARNNISTGNNKLLFENRMASYYKTGSSITGLVLVTVNYIIHEEKNIVYLEFFVTVDNVRQNASVVASFYSTVSTAALSALLQYSIHTRPYSITSFTAPDTYQVVMTIRPVNASSNVNTDAFKNDLALRITAVYREGKNTAVARRKRRALGSISTTILSITSTTDNKATVKFFILDQAAVIIGTAAAAIINRVGMNRMSSLLGVEVVVLPAAVSVPPVPATSEPALWIIGVVIGSVFVMLLFFACLYWRWKVGGPQQKLDIEKIQMADKGGAPNKPYGGYKEIASYTAEGRSEGGSGGGGGLKTTAFIEPIDAKEKPDMTRSTRRKGKPNEAASQPVKQRHVNGRANASYEESDEEYEDDDEDEDEEDEEDEDEDDYEDPPPRKPEPPRPVSAQRRVEVQPGPSRASAKVVEKMQRRIELEDQIQENREMPVAAELPPLSKMKDVQEAPSYPPVRFRTNFEPEASTKGHLPPIFQHKSLTGRPLPDLDPELRQKADLERSRNKQRQRLRASGKRTDASPMEVSTKDRKAWRKAQNEIDALLDPFSATLKRSPRSTKRAKRRHRLRRSHKVDIAIDGPKKADESKSVKLNNYMSLENPSYSSETEKSQDMAADSENEKNIEDAKERIHNLLDDAFSLLGTSPRTKKQAKEKVYEEIEVEKTEAGLQQAPPESETERSRYPALPPPPHGRATTPLRGERKRILNYPSTPIQNRALPPNDAQALAPVLTRDPMVVMDRSERNRYLSQRHGQPVYSRPYYSPSYPYSETPSAQPVYITPVQQQPDNLSGVIWSPYATEVIRDDIKNSTELPLNAVGSSSQDRHSAKIPPNISTMPKSFEPMRPHHTSIDMSNPIYDSQLYGSSPQPLIRAIKDELLRLSRSAKGKTEIQDLRTSQDQGHYPFT